VTVIAAKIVGNEVHFAADRQTTAGYSKRTDKELNLCKLMSVNGMLIGGAGLKSHSLWFHSFARNHMPLESTEVDVSQFMLEFVEFMKKKDGNFKCENEFLIAFRGKLFRVYDSLSVFEIPEFSAIGSGSQFAIAAMHLGHEPKIAAQVAADLDLHCSGEIDVMVHVA